MAYASWAGKALPDEVEWELAARGGLRGATYAWGDEPTPRGRVMANTWQGDFPVHNDLLDGYDRTSPVGVFPANGYGLVDMTGNVWEWTATTFEPFPGFSVDPYEDYSRPWFGNHKVLKGGSWATRARMIRPGYRNFYTPDRRDVFAGFRTCAT